jgi:hypothetical protein
MRSDPSPDRVAALLEEPVEAIERVRGFGRNSGVYRVRANGRSYALKRYPPRKDPGERDRATIEFGALRFLAASAIDAVPRAVAVDKADGYCLMEWIEGDPVSDPQAVDVTAVAEFLASIHELRGSDDARAQPLAAEACPSGAEIVVQIERRLARLSARTEEAALVAFLDDRFRPLLAQITAWSVAGYAAAGLAFERPVGDLAHTLCPADFGFHNALRRASTGQLVFIDFDYFGWDDPVKLTADFLLHPGMQLPEALKQQFAAAARAIYRTDPTFDVRLPLLYPLFALRWATILLNEFLPERWAYRLNAGGEADWQAAKQRQLDRAREWMHCLATNFQRFPYGE